MTLKRKVHNMRKTEKALAAAILEICKLNEECRQMRENLANAMPELLRLREKELREKKLQQNLDLHTISVPIPNTLCSLNYSGNIERSAENATQQTDTECPHS
jgi:hypothetical protein